VPHTRRRSQPLCDTRGTPIPQLAGPREENLASLARLVAARRGDQVRIEEVKAADPDSQAAADGSLLPGPHAELAGRRARNGSPLSQKRQRSVSIAGLPAIQVITGFRAGRAAGVMNVRPFSSAVAG
jgi:hypothetical protein